MGESNPPDSIVNQQMLPVLTGVQRGKW